MFTFTYDLVQSTNEIMKLRLQNQQWDLNFHTCKKLAIENPTNV
jgi:hypothetical protein